jgi:phosphonate transport system ATP-binding protein
VRGAAFRNVGVRLGGVEALGGVTFDVEPGERLAVVGASGAGKSTLLRVLTRGVPLWEGRVEVGEHDLYSLSRRDLRDLRRRIGTIYQAYNLVPQLPAGVNVALGEVGVMGFASTLRAFVAGPDAGLSKRVLEALEEVGLGGKGGVRTADLSGGQQQRVAVARLLVQRPDLILADEPFAAVDPVTTERVLEALHSLNRAGATLLVNLHDAQIARRFPRIVALRDGLVVFDGPGERLTEEMLAEVYADDPREREVTDLGGGGVRSIGKPISIAEGRDGVSSH